MSSRLDNPTAAFLSWFGTIPMLHRQYLARLFFLCTTSNSTDFALSPDIALERLHHCITVPDFPLRSIARLVVIRSVFDLLMDNRKYIDAAGNGLHDLPAGKNVLRMTGRQWEKTASSWRALRRVALTDEAIGVFLKTVV